MNVFSIITLFFMLFCSFAWSQENCIPIPQASQEAIFLASTAAKIEPATPENQLPGQTISQKNQATHIDSAGIDGDQKVMVLTTEKMNIDITVITNALTNIFPSSRFFPDPDNQRIIVSAASSQLPAIEQLFADLSENTARREETPTQSISLRAFALQKTRPSLKHNETQNNLKRFFNNHEITVFKIQSHADHDTLRDYFSSSGFRVLQVTFYENDTAYVFSHFTSNTLNKNEQYQRLQKFRGPWQVLSKQELKNFEAVEVFIQEMGLNPSTLNNIINSFMRYTTNSQTEEGMQPIDKDAIFAFTVHNRANFDYKTQQNITHCFLEHGFEVLNCLWEDKRAIFYVQPTSTIRYSAEDVRFFLLNHTQRFDTIMDVKMEKLTAGKTIEDHARQQGFLPPQNHGLTLSKEQDLSLSPELLPKDVQESLTKLMKGTPHIIGYWFGDLSIPGTIEIPLGKWQLQILTDHAHNQGETFQIELRAQDKNKGFAQRPILANTFMAEVGKPVILGWGQGDEIYSIVLLPEESWAK